MAIPKIKSQKVEHSRESKTHLGISAGLVLVSLILCWSGISRIAYRGNLVAALQASDRNHVGNIGTALDGAIKWRPDAPVPRLLLAKRMVDEDALPKAEEIYKKLLEESVPQANQCHCGLGVIALRKADKAGAAAAAAPFLKIARESFKRAGGLVEAEIGLRHADLIEAVQAKDSARIYALRSDFSKIQQKVRTKAGAEMSRESMIDLYAGLGLTYAWGGVYSEDAAKAFNGCYNYAPSWALPMINRVYIEAEQFAQQSTPLAKLKQDHADIDARRKIWEDLGNGGNPLYKDLQEAWFQFTLALAFRFAEEGDLQTIFANTMSPLMSNGTWRQRAEVWKLDCAANFRNAMRPMADPTSKTDALGLAKMHFDDFLKQDLATRDDPKFAELRATVVANRAACDHQIAVFANDPRSFEEAARGWTEALGLEKSKLGMPEGSYETNRNLAVAMKLCDKAEAGAPFFATAVRLGEASKSDRVRADVAELKEFWAK